MINDYNADHDRKGCGMNEETFIWICIFANNQNDLNVGITDDSENQDLPRPWNLQTSCIPIFG